MKRKIAWSLLVLFIAIGFVFVKTIRGQELYEFFYTEKDNNGNPVKYLPLAVMSRDVINSKGTVAREIDAWLFPKKKNPDIWLRPYFQIQKTAGNDNLIFFPKWFTTERWSLWSVRGDKTEPVHDYKNRLIGQGIRIVWKKQVPLNALVTFIVDVKCYGYIETIVFSIDTFKSLDDAYFFAQVVK